jgi:hypothetical protein
MLPPCLTAWENKIKEAGSQREDILLLGYQEHETNGFKVRRVKTIGTRFDQIKAGELIAKKVRTHTAHLN